MFAEAIQTFVLPQGYRKTDDGRVILHTQDGQPLYLTEEQFVILEDGLLLVTDELAQNTMQSLPVMGALRANGLLTGTPLASGGDGFIETTTDNLVWTGGRGPIQDFGLGTYQLAQAGVAQVAEETVDTVDTGLLLGSGVSLIALVSGLFGATASSDQTEAETPDGGTVQPPSGGGGGGGGTTFSGTVIKGPLVNAFVFFDENGNGLFDAGEPNFTTSSTGGFSISSSAANPKLIVKTNDQTIDTTTGTILSGMTFKSPLGASVVSPLTTMMEESGLSVAEIKSVLGLPATVNPLTFNPYAPGVNAADALAAEQVSAQTMVTLAAFAAAAAGTGISQQDAFAAALSALSSVMQSKNSGGGTLDLTDPTDLAAVQSAFTTAVGSIPGVTADQTTAINGIIGDATTAIQNVNNKIASITNTDLSSAANGNIFGLLQVLQDQVEKAAEDEKTTPGSGIIGFTDPTAVDNAATNSAPTDIDLSASSISEDASSLVVGVLTTTDDSTSDFNFTYEIAEIEGWNDHSAFSINPANGELSFIAQPDFETKSSYIITIIATDEGGKSFSETFTITVTDAPENQAPTFGSATTSTSVPENTSGAFYTAAATDADSDSLTYSVVGGADGDKFEFDGTGLKFKSAPDFENPTDAPTPPDNVYEVQIQADDGNGGTASQTVSVSVTNVDDFALSLNQQTTQLFGNDGTALDNGIFEGVSDTDGKLVVTFTGDGTDYRLKYLAHDMDNSGHPPGEMSISLNGVLIGYVPETTPDMSTAQVQTSLPASSQVIGYNVLEFQNINPSFNWGLGQFLLTDTLTDPAITGVVISGAESDGSTPKAGTLVAGDKILVTVTVDENITVDTSGGTPQYTIDVGGVSKTADYVSGSGGTSLVFAYEVQAGDLDDAGGITSDTSALDANSGTLQDSDGHDLDLTTIAVSAGANTVGVDAASPTVTGVVISGAESDGSTPKAGTLVAGDKILVTVTVDENITVDTSGGTPQYTIDVGGVSKTADYVSGSGGTSLVFAYEVQAGDLDDAGGITSDTSALDANSGTLQDSDGHDLDLTTIAVSAGANTVGVDAASPTVTGVVISGAQSDGSTPKAGTLVAGDKILVTVTVDENITVDTSGGTPQYTIDVGGVSKTADYVSGSGGTSLVFAYEVQAGDLDDAGGITSDTSALDANSGTLQDSDGHDLDLTTVAVSAGANTVGVDAASPTVTGVVISGAQSDGSTPKAGTLVAGDKILVTVTVDENITVDTSGGTPQYTIDVGGVSKTADYVSGSGGTSLVFAYEVQAGDLDDAGGITSDTSALDANSGTLQDSDGHDLDLTTIAVSAGANTVGVDAASPTVTGVVISGAQSDGSTPKAGTLVAGDKILVTVTVDENITVDTSGGTPQYTIDVGGVSKTADYVSGSGGTSLVFAYEVQAGDLDDAGGITSDTSALDANSGTLQDSDGHDLDLTTIAVSAGANTVGVDAASPTVTGVVISGAQSDGSTPKAGTLVAGDKILVTVTVDENITVDTSGGTPQYTIDVGGVSKTADYVSGSGGTSLVFAYEVQAGDLDDAGGITSDTSALDANSGTLQDSDGHDLDLTTIAVSAGANTVGVDAASPTVTGVVISGAQSDGSTPKAGTLVAGDKILVTVTVDENITVDTSGGTPQYTIDVGGVSKTADYVSGSGGTSLVFAYEVQAGDLDDAGGITSDTSALDANSGTLQDSDGHDLDLTTIAVSAGANTVGVDAASPTVTGVVISGAQSDGSTPKAGTLVAGDKILVTVTVDENITVDTSGGTPQYTIDVGGVSKTADYVSGSGGTSLVFAYEVQAGDLDDAGGITSDTSALDANSGTLQDSDGHDLDLTTIAVSAGANTVGVDAASPTVTGVVISGAESDGSTPKAGTLVAGDKILVTVTVDENITVDTSGGTPQYTIDVGGVSKTADYVSGSGGTSLVFAYEVQAGDLDDAGGITSDTSALDANSGTLQDSDGHDLDLTTIAVSAGANTVGVDAASPTVSINSLEIFSGSTGSHSYSPIMHGLGDLNEDGFDDFALAPFRSTDPGKFHIVFGRANSGSLEDRIDIDVGHTHKATITNDLGSTGFGASIAFAASLTSQGSQDILVYQEGGDISQFGTYPSTAFILPYTEIEGALVNGDAALSTIGRVNITDLQGGINLGVVTGDFNGDGQSDLHLGSQKAVAGGRSHFIEAAGQFTLGETVSVYDLTSANGFNNEGGESSGDLTAAFFQGDIDADGFDELVVHGLNHDPNGHLSGQVYLVWGTDNYQTGTTYGLHNTTDARWTIIDGPQIRSLIQVMSTHSGDVIGDDKPDLVISARNIDRNFRDIFVLDGSYLATRPAHVDLASFTEAMGVQVTNVGLGQTNAEILTDLTSDLDGDGKAEIGFGSAELTGVNGQAGIIYSSGLANAGASFDLAANLNQVTLIDDSNATSRFGLSFRSIGDIDGDAEDDYAIGFTDETLALEGVQIVSGNDLKVPGSNLVVQNSNSRPFFSSISATIEFAENGSGTVYTPAATDPDSNALTYTINSGADADKFELVGGALTFKQAPDFENPTDASTPPDNVYEVQIQADDGNGGTATQSVSVTVTDVVGGFVINGIDAGDWSGFSASSAGDINNDGYDDIIIGASGGDPNGESSGESYVVFGKAAGTYSASLELSDLDGTNGFVINGIDQRDFSGRSVSSAGDINNDGYDDIIIGAYGGDPNGESYVVFGKAAGYSASLELSDLNGTDGFVINGIDAGDWSGYSVSSAGDVNNDGYDDIIIGAIAADPNGSTSGESYVVFGKATGYSASLELSDIDGTNGFVINGIDESDHSGWSVSSAGDINNDGYDDIIIGAPRPSGNRSGESYVVFGKATGYSASLELSALDGTDGFVINGIDVGDNSGTSVSSAGDINNDGFDDIIIGAWAANPNGPESGETYVVFGKASGTYSASLELSALNGTDGFVINGIDAGDWSGYSVSSAGDINNDGYDDIIIGAYRAEHPNGKLSGESYVVFGKETGFLASLELSALNGTNGFVINGIDKGYFSGSSVSSAGDVNNDGYDDIIIGAYGVIRNGGSSGESYVVFGQSEFDAFVNLSDLALM